MGGPIWSAPIHDQEWVNSILNGVKSMKDRYPAYDRICAVLTTISEELPDVPLFLSLHSLSATLKCTSPSAALFRSAVINAKYRVSGSHVNPLGIKTDAPMEIIWDIMRCWVNQPFKSKGTSFECHFFSSLIMNELVCLIVGEKSSHKAAIT
jgi:tRNA (guanine26-N2/guanine27-N2)-dimethyltransferase